MKRLFSILLMITALFLPAPCISQSLAELEKKVGLSDDALLLDLELSLEMANGEKTEAEGGMKIAGGIGLGWSREPESLTNTSMIDYEKIYGQISLIYPLWGSRLKEQAEILASEKAVLLRRHAVASYRKAAVSALRREYITLWSAGRKRDIAKGFLKDETFVSSVLRERIRPGFLLKADYHEFMTMFERVERDLAILESAMERSRKRISRLTGTVEDSLTAGVPDLPRPEMDGVKVRDNIALFNPEIGILEKDVSKTAEIMEKNRWASIESHADLTYAPARTFPGAFGNGLSVSLNVRAPLNLLEAKRAAENAAGIEIRRSKLSLRKIIDETMEEYAGYRSSYLTSLENLSFAGQRLAASFEAMREARLRLKYTRGDVFEKFIQARFALYNSVLDSMDAEAACMTACSDLLRVAEDPKETRGIRPIIPEALPGYEPRKRWTAEDGLFEVPEDAAVEKGILSRPKKPVNGGFGVYIWNSGDFLKPPPGFWKMLKGNGITRILVSFHNGQIKSIENGRLGERLHRFLEEAKNRGILTELLLGEPSWILPEKRKSLLRIIGVFKDYSFDGRSEERRVGKECRRLCRSRWSPYH
jgi:outer membrane protein TolC